MRFVALLALLPTLAFGQGVVRTNRFEERSLWSHSRSAALAASALIGGTKLSANAYQVTRVTMNVSVISGGGAGNTVIRVCIPDANSTCASGTNVCSATFSCTGSNTLGPKEGTLSGTCTFPPSSLVVADIGTAGCTTSQPTTHNIEIKGIRLN